MGAVKEKWLNNIPAEELYPLGIDDCPEHEISDEEGDIMERYFEMDNRGRRISHGIRRIWQGTVDKARRILQK